MNETIERTNREEREDREWKEMNLGIHGILALEATRVGVEKERKLGGFGRLARLFRWRVAWYRLGFFDGWLKGVEYGWDEAHKMYAPELKARRDRYALEHERERERRER